MSGVASAATTVPMANSSGWDQVLGISSSKRTRAPMGSPSSLPTPQEELTSTAPSENSLASSSTPDTLPTDTLSTATPTPEIDPSPTPTLSDVPTISSPTGTPTSVNPSPTITDTLLLSTPTPTIPVTATATLQPFNINEPYEADQVIVQFEEGLSTSEIEEITFSLGCKLIEEIPQIQYWVLQVPPGQVPNILALLHRNPKVKLAEPNYIAHAYSVPNDPDLEKQDYLTTIQVRRAWDITTGSPDIAIALIDTGLDIDHPDLSNNIWLNQGEIGADDQGRDKRHNQVDDDHDGYIDDWQGWNAIDNDGDIQDDNGHGTHVAGIAAADTNNKMGIAGISWEARVIPLKALNKSGIGTYAQISKALIFAAQHRAQIINLSAGGTAPSHLLEAAVDFAYNSG